MLQIKGQQVEIVHKYLGTILDKLDWTKNSDNAAQERDSTSVFPQEAQVVPLKKPDLLESFYQATIESIIWFNSLCFFNSLRIVDATKLHRVVQTASRLTGSEVTDATVTHTMRGRSSCGYGLFWLMKIIL